MKVTDFFFVLVFLLLILSLFFQQKFLYVFVSLIILVLALVLMKNEQKIMKKKVNHLRKGILKKDTELNLLRDKVKTIKKVVNNK